MKRIIAGLLLASCFAQSGFAMDRHLADARDLQRQRWLQQNVDAVPVATTDLQNQEAEAEGFSDSQISEYNSENEAQSTFDSDAQDSYEEQDSSDDGELGITDVDMRKFIEEDQQCKLEMRKKATRELFEAIDRSSEQPFFLPEIEKLIAAGAEVNATNCLRNWGETSLRCAMFRGKAEACKLLLARGADMSKEISIGNTVLSSIAQEVGEVIHPLLGQEKRLRIQNAVKASIKHANFIPYYNEDTLEDLKETMLLALWALKHAKPCLPKDVCNLIFMKDPELRQACCAMPIGSWHAGRYERIPCMPFSVIRTLINAKKFKPSKAVGALVGHTYKRLKPLMEHACQFAKTDEMKAILNPNALDDQFGEEIQQNFKTRLGIEEIDEELESPCFKPTGAENCTRC